MSSIDNRIVVLTFDNKDFERNVQTSMNTLDKLKHGLNLEGATKGLTALSASAKSFNLNPIGAAIEAIRDRFSNLGIVGMTVLQNLTNTAVDFGKRLIGGLFEPLTAGGWKRALDIEQATFQMDGLIGKTEGGAQKIKAIMNEVSESVKGTAFGANEAARVASQLVATGIEDADKMRKYLNGVAGAAAMTGGAYDEIGHIFTTVAGNGRLMGDQLQQFAYRGLNVAATLSKQMDITEAEFRELVSKGQISFEQFAEGMALAFGDQAVKANDTFTGSLANMRAALARIGQDVATPALTYLRDLFNSLRLLIDAVHERLKPFIETLNTGLTGAAKRATSFVDSLTEALGGTSARMKKEMEETAEVTEQTAASVSKSTEEIEEMARRVLSNEFGTGDERRAQLEALGYSYEEVQNKVNELLGCEYRYEVQTEETTEAIKEAAKETENFTIKSQTLAQALGSEIFENFSFSIWNIKKALEQFGSILKKSFLSVFDGRQGEKILIKIRDISEAFQSFTQKLLLNGDQQKGLQLILEGVFTVLSKGLDLVLKGVEYYLKFAGVIAGAVKSLLGFIGAFSDANSELDRTSRKVRFLEALGGVFRKVGEAIKGFKDKLAEVLERVTHTGGFMKLKSTLQSLWETLKEIGGKILDKVIEKMEKFAGTELNFDWMDGIVSILGKAAGKLADFVQWIIDGIPKIQSFFSSIKDGTNDSALGKFIEFFITAKDAVVDFFKGLGGEGEDGEKINLFETIKNMFQTAIEDIGEFFGSLKTEGFVKGFKEFIGNIATAMSGTDTQEILGFLKEVGKIIMQIVLFASVVKFFKSASSMMEGIGSFFTGIGGYFKNLASTAKATIVLVAIGELIAALYVISKIPSEDLLRSVITLGAIVAGVIAALKIVDMINLDDNKMKSFAIAMAGLGTGLLALSGAMVILSKFSWPDFLNAAGKLAILITMLVAAAKIAGNAKCAAAFMGLAVAVDLLVPAIAILGHFKWETILKAAVAIGLIVTELGVAARIAGNVKAAAAFMGLAVAVDLLVPAFGILGKFKWETIKKGAIALGIIVTEIAVACRIASSPDALKGAVAFLAITVPLAAAIIGIKVLGNMERDKLIQGAAALTAIIAAVAGATRLAKEVKIESIVAMAALLVIAIGGLYILKDAPWESLLAGGVALSAILLSLAGAMKIAEDVKPNVTGFLAMLIPLAGAIAGLYILKDAPWESLLAGGVAMSMVMLAMAGALKIAEDVQPLGALALDLVSLSVIPIAIALSQLAEYDWQNLLGAATGLSEVILACAVGLKIFGGRDFMGAVSSIAGAVTLGASIDIIMGFITGFTAILGKIDDWTNSGFLESVQKGKEILEAVGQAIGAFIGGIGEGITSTLPGIADNLSSFAEKLTPFFETMKGFGSDIASTIVDLSAALLAITGAEFIDNITHFISGGSSLSEFGQELQDFGPALKNFWLNCKSIGEGDLTGASGALHDVASAAGTIPNEGLSVMSVLVGDNTLGKFGEELLTFGPALKNFWLNCKSIGDGDLTGAANSLTEISKAAGEIPNEGLSVMSVLVGDNTLGKFGAELLAFGPALKNFWLNCKSIGAGDLTGAANALTEIGKAAGQIPNEGLSVMSVIFGDNTLSKFGPELEAFGPSLKKFAESVTGLDQGSVSVAATALKDIVSAAAEIPNQGLSVASIVVGDNTLSKFGEELEKFGPHMAAFADSVKDVATHKVLSIAAAMPDLVTMAVAVKDSKKSDLIDFGAGLKDFGEKLKSYYESISGISTSKIQQVIQTVYRLIEVGNEMALVSTDAMGNFGSALENVGSVGVDMFVSAFENSYETAKAAVGGFVQSGQDGAEQFVSVFQTYAGSAYSAVSYMAYQAAAGASSANMEFYYAGQNAANGMINGLNSMANSLYWAAYNVASSMASAARSALRIMSPSRVMFEIGDYAGQGLAAGIQSTLPDVSNAGTRAANTVVESVSNTIDAIQNALADNLDLTPTITPVLDLTSLTDGTNALSGLFDSASPRLSYATSYGGTMLDSVMGLAEKLATGAAGNDTIVNAIKEVRSDVANLGAAITRMQIRLDGQALVGEIVDPIDEALGERMDMRQRGLI